MGEKILTFGVSGDLYDSNLLMYDRNTNSEWLQVTGTAVEGSLAGKQLRVYPIAYDTWGHWKAAHPTGRVLSIHTPYERRFGGYGVSPYAGYDNTRELWFYAGHDDERLNRKARVIGVEVGGAYKAYREDDVWRLGAIEDRIGGIAVTLIADRASSRIGMFRRGGRHFTLHDGKVTDEASNVWQWSSGELSNGDDRRPSYPVISTYWFAWAAIHPITELFGERASPTPSSSP